LSTFSERTRRTGSNDAGRRGRRAERDEWAADNKLADPGLHVVQGVDLDVLTVARGTFGAGQLGLVGPIWNSAKALS
jgi:hypothetical protein